MTLFRYDDALIAKFPNTVGGVIYSDDINNAPSPNALQQAFATEQQTVIAQVGGTSLSKLPTLSAWRSTFSNFGVSPTKYRSAPEALLRRLTKKGDIPTINALVDIGNLVSIRYKLPVAVFDLQSMQETLTVRFANGAERYTELGSNDVKHPEVGEVIFADEAGLVFARRWCWKQSYQSAAKLTTSRILVTIEAQHINGHVEVGKALADMRQLLAQHLGGTYEASLLHADNRSFAV